MNAAGIIARFSRGALYAITRRVASTYADGYAVAGATSTFTITCSPVPATGEEIRRLPEGRQSFETRTFNTSTLLISGEQAGSSESDMMTLDGKSWEVFRVQTWPVAVADQKFYTVYIQRVDA